MASRYLKTEAGMLAVVLALTWATGARAECKSWLSKFYELFGVPCSPALAQVLRGLTVTLEALPVGKDLAFSRLASNAPERLLWPNCQCWSPSLAEHGIFVAREDGLWLVPLPSGKPRLVVSVLNHQLLAIVGQLQGGNALLVLIAGRDGGAAGLQRVVLATNSLAPESGVRLEHTRLYRRDQISKRGIVADTNHDHEHSATLRIVAPDGSAEPAMPWRRDKLDRFEPIWTADGAVVYLRGTVP